jgi:uncharacterized protein (DUF1015 family)
MATIRPFAALRPRPDLAERICELPYDVMSSEEALAIASGNPLSFLRVSKPEIELPPSTNVHAPEVYARGRDNFQRLIAQGALRPDTQPCFYLYRQVRGSHSQVGIVAGASCEDYLSGVIKKHELTRPDKEDDRVHHIQTLRAQTGPAFLVYRSRRAINELVARKTAEKPDIDFVAPDGVRHTAWVIADANAIHSIQTEFERIPALYIADGHHRSAAAVRIYQAGQQSGASAAASDNSASFLSVIFPHDQVQILPYNRVVKDLNGLPADEFLRQLEPIFAVRAGGGGLPVKKHDFGLYLSGQWRALSLRPHLGSAAAPADRLDVTLLQNHVLGPILGIGDPRTSQRLHFVGGIRGAAELEKLVNSNEFACAFSLFPTSIEDLMAIADANAIMPPKSTWFEPKLRDAMFCYVL